MSHADSFLSNSGLLMNYLEMQSSHLGKFWLMEAKVVKFKLLKRIILICNTYIAYDPYSYRLWSTL